MYSGKPNKGLRGKAYRASILPTRYGLTSERIRQRLRELVADMQQVEITPTIPVTGRTLERHGDLLANLDGAEIAVHGYRHVAYSTLTPEARYTDLVTASGVFAAHGIRVCGFRAPYLSLTPDTLGLLRDRGFAYDSSASQFFGSRVNDSGELMRICARRYRSLSPDTQSPFMDSGIAEIPVSLPDDEMLVDGLGIRQTATLAKTLLSMLTEAEARRCALVLQIHPERYGFLREALRDLVVAASDRGAWKAPLRDIAHWVSRPGASMGAWPEGRPFALAVTGDLDAASLSDFGGRILGGR